jgi:hypothetical protein
MTMTMIRRVVLSILPSFELHGDDMTAGNNDVAGVLCHLPREIRNCTHVTDARICERVTVELLYA